MSDSVNKMAGGGWARWLPAAGWLASYQRPWLRGDMVAGLTAAAVVIPQAMAYATIAGLPLVTGLYTARARRPPSKCCWA